MQARQRDVSPCYHCDIWLFSLAQEPESNLWPLVHFSEVIVNKKDVVPEMQRNKFKARKTMKAKIPNE